MAFLNVSFPDIDWEFSQSAYGWPALQYQLWARGMLEITGTEPQTVALFSGGLLEFWVDEEHHFGGDLYQYRRAPVLLQLPPGLHLLDLRLTRDVRALGGLSNSVEVVLEAELREEPITLDQGSLLVSEMSQRRLGGIWGSINVQNNGAGWAEITSIRTYNVCLPTCYKVTADMVSDTVSTQDVTKGNFTIGWVSNSTPFFHRFSRAVRHRCVQTLLRRSRLSNCPRKLQNPIFRY
jgi:hypothetical protein